MDENKNENENTNEDFLLIYKRDSMMSLYLTKILEGQGKYFSKGIINRDIVISKLGEFNILYGMDTHIDEITNLLMMEVGIQQISDNQNDEPKSLLDKGNQFYKPKSLLNRKIG